MRLSHAEKESMSQPPVRSRRPLKPLTVAAAAAVIITLAGLIALKNPMLMGWRSRKEAIVVLAIAVTLIGAGWLARTL